MPELREISYKLPDHFEDWKHEIANEAANKAVKANIEPKYLIAAMVLESGINPSSVGDSGCSLGVLQLNRCVHKKTLSTSEQIDLWLANFSKYYEKTGSWEAAVIAWNAPAHIGKWWQTRYWKHYSKTLNSIL